MKKILLFSIIISFIFATPTKAGIIPLCDVPSSCTWSVTEPTDKICSFKICANSPVSIIPNGNYCCQDKIDGPIPIIIAPRSQCGSGFQCYNGRQSNLDCTAISGGCSGLNTSYGNFCCGPKSQSVPTNNPAVEPSSPDVRDTAGTTAVTNGGNPSSNSSFSDPNQCTIINGRDKPAADDPDVNLRRRGWVDSTETNKNLIDVGGPTDDLAPQFSTIVGNSPNIVGMYQINLWDWSTNTRAGPIPKDENSNWGVTLLELGTNEVIRAPKSGYEITSTGYKYTVLYADANTITIKGTLEDNAISGYTIHFVDLNVNPEILNLYNQNEASGRKRLVAMPCGYELGTPRDSKFKLAIADTGTFIDPRVRKDWWHAPANDSCASLPLGYVDTLPTEICSSNKSTKKGPLAEGFKPLDYPCDKDTGFKKEYHPLRPYPGSPCDPLIARSIPEAPSSPEKKFNTFACGTSLTPSAIERFDPYGKNGAYENLPLVEGYAHTICEPREGTDEFAAIARSGGTVTCWRTSAFDITVDLSHANVGILGNTQDNSLTDAQKVNEYLSWYLTGTPQIGDQLPINPKNPNDLDRVVNYSGPIRKLLPFDLQNIVKKTIVESVDKKEIHNYIVGCKKDVDLTYVLDALKAWLDTSLTNAGLVWWAALNLTPRLPFDIYDFVTKYTQATVELTTVLKNFTPGDTPKILAILTPLGNTALGEDLGKLGEKSVESLKKLSNLINTLNLDMAESCQTSNDAKRLKEFADHLPPDPADLKYKDNFNKYWDDYIWWRGMINLPLIGPVDWVNQDIWARLFQNIPFSSMEDTTGEFTMSVFKDPSFDQQVDSLDNPQYSPIKGVDTAPLKLIIKSAEKATK